MIPFSSFRSVLICSRCFWLQGITTNSRSLYCGSRRIDNRHLLAGLGLPERGRGRPQAAGEAKAPRLPEAADGAACRRGIDRLLPGAASLSLWRLHRGRERISVSEVTPPGSGLPCPHGSISLVGWAAIYFGRHILRIADSTGFMWFMGWLHNALLDRKHRVDHPLGPHQPFTVASRAIRIWKSTAPLFPPKWTHGPMRRGTPMAVHAGAGR